MADWAVWSVSGAVPTKIGAQTWQDVEGLLKCRVPPRMRRQLELILHEYETSVRLHKGRPRAELVNKRIGSMARKPHLLPKQISRLRRSASTGNPNAKATLALVTENGWETKHAGASVYQNKKTLGAARKRATQLTRAGAPGRPFDVGIRAFLLGVLFQLQKLPIAITWTTNGVTYDRISVAIDVAWAIYAQSPSNVTQYTYSAFAEKFFKLHKQLVNGSSGKTVKGSRTLNVKLVPSAFERSLGLD